MHNSGVQTGKETNVKRTRRRFVRRYPWAGYGATAAVLGGLAWFFGGIIGLLAAAIGLAIAAILGPRWVGAAAFGSMVIAALATVLEEEISNSYGITFARDRPIASNSALAAGVLALVAVVTFAAREREQGRLGSIRWRLPRGEHVSSVATRSPSDSLSP
jgi:hypothetical protein